MKPLVIHTCPMCKSKRIRLVKRDIISKRGGRETVVPDVEFHECPDCHERLFSPEAIDYIAAVASRKQKQPA
jgi:YgiT-type zinc finger domain-containing protein